MKALVLEEYNHLVYKDVDDPVIKGNEVLVKVMACGICGSDVHGMDGSSGRRIPPIIMGHEASGIIKEAGCLVKDWEIGDRVTFDSTVYPLDDWYTEKGLYNLSDNREVLGVSPGEYRRHGAFADFVAIPAHILHKIPDKVSLEHAAMVEPVAVASHAINLTNIEVGDTALVVGAGMIGLFIIQVLRQSEVNNIIAIDLDEDKLSMASAFGADKILIASSSDLQKEILNVTGGRGADIAFEAVGIHETVKTAIENVRKGGTVTLVGNLTPTVDLPLQSVVTQQIRLQGSCAIAGEYPQVLKMLEEKTINVDPMISAVAPLSEGASWFERLYNKEKGLKKVVLVP
ncbi:galactitol-1-phosphate 5-dehydrogenase [Bacteroidota bacterium]